LYFKIEKPVDYSQLAGSNAFKNYCLAFLIFPTAKVDPVKGKEELKGKLE
jgi:hypothetical protein